MAEDVPSDIATSGPSPNAGVNPLLVQSDESADVGSVAISSTPEEQGPVVAGSTAKQSLDEPFGENAGLQIEMTSSQASGDGAAAGRGVLSVPAIGGAAEADQESDGGVEETKGDEVIHVCMLLCVRVCVCERVL